MKLNRIFSGLRKGLDMLERARKVLTSVEILGKHLNAMVDELETVWGKDVPKETEEVEV